MYDRTLICQGKSYTKRHYLNVLIPYILGVLVKALVYEDTCQKLWVYDVKRRAWYILAVMIKWTVRDVAERAGIVTAYELWKQAGIHPKTAYRLWNGTATRVDIQTLEKLCVLFKVPVGQLLQHIDSVRSR